MAGRLLLTLVLVMGIWGVFHERTYRDPGPPSVKHSTIKPDVTSPILDLTAPPVIATAARTPQPPSSAPTPSLVIHALMPPAGATVGSGAFGIVMSYCAGYTFCAMMNGVPLTGVPLTRYGAYWVTVEAYRRNLLAQTDSQFDVDPLPPARIVFDLTP